MKGLFETLRNIYKIEDLRLRIYTTLGLILIYRLGSYVVLPGVDPIILEQANQGNQGGLTGLLDMFAGGAFSRASIFALGIMPYISASIVIQLLGVAVPYFQRLQKEGESGRTKINQLTRYLTILITGVQAPGYIANLKNTLPDAAFLLPETTFWISSVIILVTGTLFAMWLGEKITDKGIGNGISLLITVGIIATMPLSFVQEFVSRVTENNGGLIMILVELVIWIIVNGLCVLLVLAVRQIPVQYARRTAA